MEGIFRCAVLILYEHDDENFPYSRGATCFLAQYSGSLFAITANHAIVNSSSEIGDIRILAAPGAQAFLPLLGMTYSRVEESHGDIAIINIDAQGLNAEGKGLISPLDLDIYNRSNTFSTESSILCLRGYPDEFYAFDYEREEINATGYYAEARYTGPGHQHCHRFEYMTPLDFPSASGLSGAPIIHAVQTGPEAVALDFAGMLITSGRTSGQFIDSSAIYEALDIGMSNQALHGTAYRRP